MHPDNSRPHHCPSSRTPTDYRPHQYVGPVRPYLSPVFTWTVWPRPGPSWSACWRDTSCCKGLAVLYIPRPSSVPYPLSSSMQCPCSLRIQPTWAYTWGMYHWIQGVERKFCQQGEGVATRSRDLGKLDTYMYMAGLHVCLPYTFDILLLCLLSLNTTHQLFATLSTPDSLEPQFLIIQFVRIHR